MNRCFATIAVSALLLFSYGCTQETGPIAAEPIAISQLQTSPGYTWFVEEMNIYTPRTNFVTLTQTAFTQNHKIVVFVAPSCACTGTKKLFPHLIRTLTASGVPEANIEVWSMTKASNTHPYQSTIQVTSLPWISVFRSDTLRATINELDYKGSNADSLIATALGK
jgi:hypothetical protein